MKSIILLSSLLLFSGSASAGDQVRSDSSGVSSFFSNVVGSATEIVSSRTNYQRADKRVSAHSSRQHQFDDDAYLRRISYND